MQQGSQTIATYGYDIQNRRFRKTVGSTTTYYLYNLDDQLIAEISGAGTVLREYVWLDGEPFLLAEYTGTSAGMYFYLNDHLGTPQQLLNGETGAVAWQAAYLPFGEAQVQVSTVTNNLRFPGQYYDAETGLHYNWNRYYEPKSGRYISADPIGLSGGLNLYEYGNGNSVNNYDVDGKIPILLLSGVIIGGEALGGLSANIIGATLLGGVTVWIIHDSFYNKDIKFFASNAEPNSYINEDGTVDDSNTSEEECGKGEKWVCEGYGQYEQIGANKYVRRGNTWHIAYGATKELATRAWINKVQNASPPGFTARHIRPRCKKVK